MLRVREDAPPLVLVSVLFSEPKIPQFGALTSYTSYRSRVSVLFSEPKIPQSAGFGSVNQRRKRFSALQRAENSSMLPADWGVSSFFCFSALQRAENSSIIVKLVVRSC